MNGINQNILVWNIRGLNNRCRGADVRVVAEQATASVVCLVESKLEVVDQHLIGSMLGTRFDGFVALPALGTANGIIVA